MWIGLDNLHLLAAAGKNAILRVDMKHLTWGKELFYARYNKFEISGEADGFRLTTGSYKGTAGDGFHWPEAATVNNGMKFSTFDKDQDNSPDNCAVKYEGAWWHNNCHASNLNGLYPNKHLDDAKFMSWKGLGDYGNVYFSEMKITYP